MMFGSIVGAVGNLAGGLLSAKSQASANAAATAMQREFAQNGIRWKVADAKAAGLHPLAALGAQTMSPQASMSGIDYGFLGDMGQNIGRAIQAKQTKEERIAQEAYNRQVQDLNLENMRLQNNLLASQASAINRTSLPPAMPSDVQSMPGQGDSLSPVQEYIYFKDGAGRIGRMLNPDIASTGAEEDPTGTIQRALRSTGDVLRDFIFGDANGVHWNPLTGRKIGRYPVHRFARAVQELLPNFRDEIVKEALSDPSFWRMF